MPPEDLGYTPDLLTVVQVESRGVAGKPHNEMPQWMRKVSSRVNGPKPLFEFVGTEAEPAHLVV